MLSVGHHIFPDGTSLQKREALLRCHANEAGHGKKRPSRSSLSEDPAQLGRRMREQGWWLQHSRTMSALSRPPRQDHSWPHRNTEASWETSRRTELPVHSPAVSGYDYNFPSHASGFGCQLYQSCNPGPARNPEPRIVASSNPLLPAFLKTPAISNIHILVY